MNKTLQMCDELRLAVSRLQNKGLATIIVTDPIEALQLLVGDINWNAESDTEWLYRSPVALEMHDGKFYGS